MGTWTIINIFLGLSLIAIGIIYRYRTPRFGSMFTGILHLFARRNEQIWKEAHRYMGMPLVIFGVVVLLLSLLLPFLSEGAGNAMVPGGVIIGGSVAVLTLTRRHIDNKFDENGNARA